MNTNFEDLNIQDTFVSRLKEINITEPTEVQKQVIPLILQGKHIMFQSETGTGKTFAYLLPLLTKINLDSKNASIMIATPTYELASQIKVQIQKISDAKCALLIGGAPISRQIELLKEKPQILIGGPARLLELIHLKKLKADSIESLVLDEADRLLSPELRDSTQELMERLPKTVQLIGNSATVNNFTREILFKARKSILENESDILLIKIPEQNILRMKITHWAIFAEARDKINTLRSFIYAENPKKLLVFTSRKDQIENIASKLKFKKINCEILSGKSDKRDRKAAIDRFRSGKVKILITTDLASRGLDIEGITHVVQMDLPQEEDFFIHRAGRTARAGTTGINCVIGDAFEMQNYAKLEKKLGLTVYPKMIYKGKVVDPNSIN